MNNSNKKTIYLGSMNHAKGEAVKTVFKDYEVIQIDANSNVSSQPKSDKETIEGALNRALSLPHGLRIGLEAGVEILNDILFLTNFGVLIDEDDNVYYAGGTRTPLPEFVKIELIDKNRELKDVMIEYTKIENINNKGGAISIFTCNEVQRIDIFIHICKLLLGQYKYKQEQKALKG